MCLNVHCSLGVKGMSIITFDWAQIAFIGSPLATPWWAAANVFMGFVIFYWIATPILYFTNVWDSLYMPIQSRLVYDNTLNEYDVNRVLTPEATFNKAAYDAYSPLFMSLAFATITATLTHTFLYFRNQIMKQARRSLREQPDIHARLMSVYPQVPDWWYLILFLMMFTLGVISIEVWPTHMPVWAFVVALLIGGVPSQLVLGQRSRLCSIHLCRSMWHDSSDNESASWPQVSICVISELIIGYALPGRPIAMMMFKTWGYNTMLQALNFTNDFKLGHYMKIPPREMFWCQVIAALVAGTAQLGVQSWMFSSIPDMCLSDQQDGFTCPTVQTFGSASIIWGVVGPKYQFSPGQRYHGTQSFRVEAWGA
ncbi:hypothetical protein ID866_8186 [Astraeus odoratus]|nr:hypothetical protein ID866_8186 [Astraeus odoratus]